LNLSSENLVFENFALLKCNLYRYALCASLVTLTNALTAALDDMVGFRV
jgi:hypothetical protein